MGDGVTGNTSGFELEDEGSTPSPSAKYFKLQLKVLRLKLTMRNRQQGMTNVIADRLRDPKAVAKARVFPYQLMIAYTMASANADIPKEVCDALQDAMEIATANVPEFEGKVYVFPDISGSMHSAVTGYQRGATTVVRCIDVATETMKEWANFRQRNPEARMVCIDVQPYATVQAKERPDILNIGGFSDHVFDLISELARGELNADHWIGVIESLTL